jgi:hypothetical protein
MSVGLQIPYLQYMSQKQKKSYAIDSQTEVLFQPAKPNPITCQCSKLNLNYARGQRAVYS